MRADVTAEHLTQVVRDIAVIDIDDGVAFNLDTSSVQEIRERADYPGLRVRVAMSVGPWQGIAAWDVSTGEPIAPWPTRVPAHVGRRNMDLLDAKQVSEMIGVPVGTLRHWRHSDIGPASFTLGRRVVYRRDEVSRWISKRESATRR